jgi:hypothetical protein
LASHYQSRLRAKIEAGDADASEVGLCESRIASAAR